MPNIDQPTAADNENEPYVPYYRYLLSQPTESLPQVISNSYGDEEDVSLLDCPNVLQGRLSVVSHV